MKNKSKDNNQKSGEIIIDPEKNLVFSSEEELLIHFKKQIDDIENFLFKLRDKYPKDIKETQFDKYEKNLNECLQSPDEIWVNDEITDMETLVFIKNIKKDLFHIAVCYSYNYEPSFIFMHFPTNQEDLVDDFCLGEMIFDQENKDIYPGAIEGDALSEGDELAMGHYRAMLTLRTDEDVSQEEFRSYAHLREDSIELADEIWRNQDSYGQNLVCFIKNHPDQDEVYYVVVTLEDSESDSNILLFSFPTKDEALVDRYRQGENLQADEIIQENSH